MQKDNKLSKADLIKRITVDPNISFGKPCIRGTRIWISLIMDNLAAGVSQEEILAAFPSLEMDDIRAVITYAAELTRDRYVSLAG